MLLPSKVGQDANLPDANQVAIYAVMVDKRSIAQSYRGVNELLSCRTNWQFVLHDTGTIAVCPPVACLVLPV